MRGALRTLEYFGRLAPPGVHSKPAGKNHHPLQALPGGGPPGSRVCSCFSPPQSTAFHTGSLSQPTGRLPLSTKGKTALSTLPPASHLPLLECRKLQVSWEMHICSCLCELLWPPPTVSVQRRRTCPSSPKRGPAPLMEPRRD